MSNDEPQIVLTSHEQLAYAIPVQLGYTPQNAVCAICFKDRQVIAVFTTAVPPVGEEPESAVNLTVWAHNYQPSAVIYMAWEPDDKAGSSATMLEACGVAAVRLGLRVADLIRVRDGRAWSLVRAGGIDGKEVKVDPEVATLFASAGFSGGATAQEVREGWQFTDDEQRTDLLDWVAASQDISTVDLDLAASLWGRVSQGEQFVRMPAHERATLALSVFDPLARDAVALSMLKPEITERIAAGIDYKRTDDLKALTSQIVPPGTMQQRPALESLRRVIMHTPDVPGARGLLGVAVQYAWLGVGDGIVAEILNTRLAKVWPDTALEKLMKVMLKTGINPRYLMGRQP